MRSLLDENVALPLCLTVKHLFEDVHEVSHVLDLDGWRGTKDKALWAMAAEHGFEAVLTNDGKQTRREHEVEAIARSGVHRIEYPHKHPGLAGLGLAMATVCAALPAVLEELSHSDGQRLVALTGIDPSPAGRRRLRNPAENPPKFWPGSRTG